MAILLAADAGPSEALITNPAMVLGILLVILAVIFKSSEHPTMRGFYRVVPALLLCYFVPGLLTVLAGEGEVV